MYTFEEEQREVLEEEQDNVFEDMHDDVYQEALALAQKKRKKKRRRKNYLLRLLVLVILGVGAYYGLTSSFFDVQEITVENNRHYTVQQIIHMTDARIGQNIFSTQTTQMRDALLADPYIRNARVIRSLPSSIIISVEERSEAAIVPYAGTFIVIDKAGIVLRRTNAQLELPMLMGLTVRAMDEGSPLEVEETGALTGTLQILETMAYTDTFFLKIDVSSFIVRAYIFENLICEGTVENVMASMANGRLEKLLYELYTNGVERGIIYVGGDNYYSFNPMR